MLFANVLYLQADGGTWDSDFHYVRSLARYDADRYAHVVAVAPGPEVTRDSYPPLVHVLTAWAYHLAEPSPFVARVVVSLFFPMLLCAVWGLASRTGGTAGGLMAVGLVASSPYVLDLSRRYFLDFPQVALTVTAIWLLQRERALVLAGLATGAALLAKWSAGLWLVLPLLRLRGRPLLIALGMAALVAGPWYVGQVTVLHHRFLDESGMPRSLAANAETIMKVLVHGLLAGPAWLGLAAGAASVRPERRLLGPALLVALPLAVMVVGGHPVVRYYVTAIPLLAVLVGSALGRPPRAGAILAGVAILLGFLVPMVRTVPPGPFTTVDVAAIGRPFPPRAIGLPPPPTMATDDLDPLLQALTPLAVPGRRPTVLVAQYPDGSGRGLNPEQLIDAAFRRGETLGSVATCRVTPEGRIVGYFDGMQDLAEVSEERRLSVAAALISHPPGVDAAPVLQALRQALPGARLTTREISGVLLVRITPGIGAGAPAAAPR